MTSLPVKGFDPVANLLATNGKAAAPSGTGFDAVLSKQTADLQSPVSEQSSGVKKTGNGAASNKDQTVKNEPVRTQNEKYDKKEETSKVVSDTKEAGEENQPENLEQEMEVLATASGQLIQQIMEALNVTVEDIQSMMDQLNITETQILQPENLSNLLLGLEGEADVTSLLTDEGLYASYKEVMENLATILSDAGKQLNVSQETVLDVVDEVVTFEAQISRFTHELPQEPLMEEDLENAEEYEGGFEIPAVIEDTTEEVGAVQEVARTDREDITERMDVPETDDSNLKVHEEEQEETTETEVKRTQGTSRRTHAEPARTVEHNTPLANDRPNEPLLQPEQTTVSETRGFDENTQNIMRQVMDYMRVQIRPDMSSVEMQLHPASLGSLQVQVASKGGVLTAQFITQNESVKAALESQMIQLQQSFEEQGVKVEAIEVTVQTHQFEENLQQGQNRQQNEPERRTSGRRIRLDGALSLDDLENMSEEEALTAQMMEANGNTVDYTV